MAEVDGNRTRRTGITHPTRFEGGGAHQALGHLRPATYRRRDDIAAATAAGTGPDPLVSVTGMSKNRFLLLTVLVVLAVLLARKVKDV